MQKPTSAQVRCLSNPDAYNFLPLFAEEDVPSPSRLSAKAKGKLKAVEPPFDRDPGETTTEYEVRGKEWELVNVLESHKTAEKRLEDGTAAEDRELIELERDRDKERIRILEQEVAQLRREVRRPHNGVVHLLTPSSWSDASHLTLNDDLACNQGAQRCHHLRPHPHCRRLSLRGRIRIFLLFGYLGQASNPLKSFFLPREPL